MTYIFLFIMPLDFFLNYLTTVYPILADLCNCVSHPQGARSGSDAWMPSYEVAGRSSAGGSSVVVAERRAPSIGKLSLIRDLRDQLKRAQQEVKRFTSLVDVARLKASLAGATERYLLNEIESLVKTLKCECLPIASNSFVLFVLTDCGPIFADVCLGERAKSQQVNTHLNAAQTHANLIVENF
jgi:hypothetical protein